MMPNHTSTSTCRKNKNARRKGATMVEFAVCAVPFFLLIFTCIEFSRFSMMESLAQDAAYEAARHVIVAGAKKSDAVERAHEILSILGTREADVSVTATDINGKVQSEIDDETGGVSVMVKIPMSKNCSFLARFTNDIVLTKETTLTTERYSGYYDSSSSN